MIDDLRIHAAEEPGPVRGDFVLYWMQGVAMRTHDNPALDFAAEQANRLRLPLLVYQGLRADYPWASDRIHTFILESAADLATEFERLGIQYGFYLDRRERAGRDSNGRERSPLVQLAGRAALVVTEFFPTFLMPRQMRALRSKVAAPVVAVDAGTIVLAAAGNYVGIVVYPALLDDVIACAASTIEDEPWSGSCSGDSVDITAPGASVWRAEIDRDGASPYAVTRGNGTSFAVATTAGVAALWISYHGWAKLVRRYGPAGVPRDPSEARRWYNVARVLGEDAR